MLTLLILMPSFTLAQDRDARAQKEQKGSPEFINEMDHAKKALENGQIDEAIKSFN
jgi:soluble cytochrome b562